MHAERVPDGLAGRFDELVSYWAAITPEQIALEGTVRDLSYAELDMRADQLARDLKAAGVNRSDRVLIVAENTAGAVLCCLAVSRAGACCSVLNARMALPEIRTILAFADPRMVLFPVTEALSSNAHAMSLSARPFASSEAGGDILALHLPDPVPEPDDATGPLGLIMFTSGTTGTPKGVMLTHATLLAQARAQCIARSLRSDDRIFLVSPIAHSIGFSSNILAAFASGARVIVRPRFEVGELVRKLAGGEITMLVSVPQMYTRILEYAEIHRISFEASRLRVAGVGGASLDPALKARVERVLGVGMSNGYGATEFVPIARVPAGADVASNVVGLPDPAVEVRIVDEAGNDVAPGEEGEILARGPFCMAGYFRNPEETDRVIGKDGWLATGDLGRMGADGMLSIVGRRKEIIIHSGFNVYPADVETALTAHPDVSEAAVTARHVPGNEEVVAFVTAQPGREIDVLALRDFVRTLLTPYKVPAEIIVLDAMPVGPTGKIQKARLAEMFT